MVNTKMNKSYSAPTLELETLACDDVVRTSQNLGGIDATWYGVNDREVGE